MNADQTHTIRLPKGMGSRLKAATGQPLSFLFRCMAIALLQKYEAEGKLGNVKAQVRGDVNEVVNITDIPEEPNDESNADE